MGLFRKQDIVAASHVKDAGRENGMNEAQPSKDHDTANPGKFQWIVSGLGAWLCGNCGLGGKLSAFSQHLKFHFLSHGRFSNAVSKIDMINDGFVVKGDDNIAGHQACKRGGGIFISPNQESAFGG